MEKNQNNSLRPQRILLEGQNLIFGMWGNMSEIFWGLRKKMLQDPFDMVEIPDIVREMRNSHNTHGIADEILYDANWEYHWEESGSSKINLHRLIPRLAAMDKKKEVEHLLIENKYLRNKIERLRETIKSLKCLSVSYNYFESLGILLDELPNNQTMNRIKRAYLAVLHTSKIENGTVVLTTIQTEKEHGADWK